MAGVGELKRRSDESRLPVEARQLRSQGDALTKSNSSRAARLQIGE